MFSFLFSWPFLAAYLAKSVVAAFIVALIGLGIGKLSFHEPEDDE